MTRTLSTACHTAFLDDMSGAGLLVLPRHAEDMESPATGRVQLSDGTLVLSDTASLHASDWRVVIAALEGLGFEPCENDDLGVCHEGSTSDGRSVIGLIGHRAVIGEPTITELVEAYAVLRVEAGVLPA